MKVTTLYFGEVEVLPYPQVLPVSEYLEWQTDIIEANDGGEGRAQLRNGPRQSIAFSFMSTDEQPFAAAYRSAQSSLWAVPIWAEAQYITLSAGQNVIEFPATLSDYRDESLALIWSESGWELLEVELAGCGWGELWGYAWGGTDDILGLRVPVATTRAGWLMPVRVGRLTQSRSINDAYGEYSVVFHADDPAAIPAEDPAQYKAADIYTDVPLLSGDGVEDDFTSRIDQIDNQTGLMATYTPWSNNRIVRQFRRLEDGMVGIRSMKEWLHRRGGAFREFWMPHHTRSLVAVAVSGSTLDVTGYDDSRTHVSVEAPGYLFREILSTADQGGGVTRLTLDSALGVTLEEIERVSYLGLWRMASDRVEIKYNGADIAETVIPLVELTP